ncbi:hypothetical protein LOK74_05150 [Brevibacillus humidisoli]|uniref:coiled-coil domain-containing protein n=1 Tax=Brevibacillus humidisoli TaxID=2895522 RepID=UPI001E3D31BD|nr:hypothetical protein [Brevibacillus humidisoli]UFJ41893.1 hypothetical protein LOK74_05150 [Brevibacillus humidisoli]
MRRWLYFIGITLLLVIQFIPASAEKDLPLEQLILQQHFTQKELERNLALLKQEEKDLLSEMAQLELELNRQALVIDAMKRHAGDVARAYYTGERASLLVLLLEARNFNNFLMAAEFLQLLFERDMEKLETFQQARAKAEALRSETRDRLQQVKRIRQHYEERLKEMIAIKMEKEKNLEQVDDPTSVQALMDHLVADWRERGLPTFRKFFGVLAGVMGQIPELATPDHIQSNGLFSHTLTIGEKEFNKFLISKNELFEQSYFQFADDQLIVEGSYDQINLRIVGEYELVSPTELKFHINQLMFDGFELPESTVDELEQEYDLGFYPSLINPNIRVESLSLGDQQLKLNLSLDLPFQLGGNNPSSPPSSS